MIHESALEHLGPTERACLLRDVDVLRGRLGLRLLEIHLFGSFARGDFWRAGSPMHSDVDLLVICADQPSAAEVDELVNETYPLFLECGRALSPQFRTREMVEHPTTPVGQALLATLHREGRLLFEAP